MDSNVKEKQQFYSIEPEVAGGLGHESTIVRSSGRAIVEKLHYEFDDWMGDEILESTPCYIVSTNMASRIKDAQLTGVSFDSVFITKSPEFNEMRPDVVLPQFVWLKIHGSVGLDDFGIARNLKLVVSDRALKLLKDVGMNNAGSISPFQG
jgi:hypothetical protein